MPDFVPVGGLGTGSVHNMGTSDLTMSPTADTPAGDLVVAWVANTSHYFFGPNGQQVAECSLTDSKGNRWQQLYSGYPSADAPHVALFACQLKYDLETTDVVTVRHYGGGAKNVSLHRFTIDTTKRWALLLENLPSVGVALGDPQAISIGSLDPAREYLLLHVLGAEGPNTDAYTWDSDYTQIAGAGTTTGNPPGPAPSPEDVHVRGGFRVVTGVTGDTVDVTSTGTDRDTGQAIVALTQIDVDEDYPGFPNTPLVDDFNRADEDPLDGGIWQTVAPRPQFGDRYMSIDSMEAAQGAGSTGGGSQYVDEFLQETGVDEWEVWVTNAIADLNDIGFGGGNGSTVTFLGEGVAYFDHGARVHIIPKTAAAVVWGSYGNSGELPLHQLNSFVWGVRADGHKMGMQQLTIRGDIEQHLWMDEGGGWEWVACILRTSGYTPAGQLFMASEGSSVSRFDDFGGGLLRRFRLPQIMRYR